MQNKILGVDPNSAKEPGIKELRQGWILATSSRKPKYFHLPNQYKPYALYLK
jgi:hypothetical protein